MKRCLLPLYCDSAKYIVTNRHWGPFKSECVRAGLNLNWAIDGKDAEGVFLFYQAMGDSVHCLVSLRSEKEHADAIDCDGAREMTCYGKRRFD